MRSVRDLTHVEGIPVLVRTSLNEPIVDGVLGDTFRIDNSIPTIKLLRERGAKIILASHRTGDATLTLRPMYEELSRRLSRVYFSDEIIGARVRAKIREMHPGDILLLENLRRNTGEEKNTASFVHELASLADYFVQDCFDVCHRPHASVIGVSTLLPSYAGLSVSHEVSELYKARKPKSPSLAIIGGAKFSTKESVLDSLVLSYEKVFIGGAIANDLLKARGYAVGRSKVSSQDIPPHLKKLAHHERIYLPSDCVVFNHDTKESRVTHVGNVNAHESIYDVGPHTLKTLGEFAGASKDILWNGPLGFYEEGYDEGTRTLAHMLARAKGHTVIGGGDTLDVVAKEKLTDRFSFVSTGGGAMLEYLAHGSLVGLAALS